MNIKRWTKGNNQIGLMVYLLALSYICIFGTDEVFILPY